ncbi:hypothetical protein PF004_g18591 [Phytophthora fragariae]|uniref:Uncharacterized protein n=1 Tax=Phytophthora fragariae TaxID=53985 RepID=A0A6A3J472_9STRA|nr:hypothetical protein PF009_g16457 [Phytophthora fragariae]KAE8990099.1 hypothetical protein PF011_g18491 [Phytophthora fragariae]KAE9201849.1 hypothetical protein PF004_g18591 [Phytophthora fragariae]KAE9333942.1 hypothetical protein PF008_g14201 [Phytophthora fragariae]
MIIFGGLVVSLFSYAALQKLHSRYEYPPPASPSSASGLKCLACGHGGHPPWRSPVIADAVCY